MTVRVPFFGFLFLLFGVQVRAWGDAELLGNASRPFFYSDVAELKNGRRIDYYFFSAQPYRAEWKFLFAKHQVNSIMNLRKESDDNGSDHGSRLSLDSHDQAYTVWNEGGYDAESRTMRYFWSRSWIRSPNHPLPQWGGVGVDDFAPLGRCRGPNDHAHLPTRCDHGRALKILKILTDPLNCPIEIHCHAGMGRTGSVMAILLYSYYKMEMNRAVQFSNSHGGAINSEQYEYLLAFARDHKRVATGQGCGIK